MKADPTKGITERRRRADVLLQRQSTGQTPLSAHETQLLIEELQAHRIELQLQNEEFQRAQRERETEAARHADFYELAPVGCFTLNRLGAITQSNPGAARMTGLARAELQGQLLSSFVSEADQQVFGDFLRHVGATGVSQSCELVLMTRNRTPRSVYLEARTALAGEECRVVAVDITEHKQADQELRRASQWLYASQRISAVGGWAINRKTGEVWASPEARRIYGYGNGPLTIPAIQSFPVPQDRPALDRAIRNLIDHGLPYDVEFKIKRGTDGAIVDLHSIAEYDPVEQIILGVVHDNTAKKTGDAALRASEKKFATAFHESPVAMAIREVESDRYIDVNDRCLAMLGFDREEVIGRTPEQIGWVTHPKPDDYRRLTADGCRNLELCLRQKTGGALICTYSAHRVQIGGQACLLSTILDITARKLAEDELLKRKTELAWAMDLAGLAYWELDFDSDTFVFNDRFYALYGTTAEREGGYQMSAATYAQEFLPPEDRHIVAHELARGRAQPEAADERIVEHQIIRRDGVRRHIAVRIVTVRDATGRLISFRGANQDVTDLRRTEAALRESEARYRLIVENISDVIWIRDLGTSHYVYFSPSVERQRGFTVEEAMRQSLADALTPESLALVQRLIPERIAAARRGEPQVNIDEVEQPTKDGRTVWTEVTTRYVIDEQGRVQIYGASRDITARKLAEIALAENRDLLAKLTDQVPGVVYQYRLHPDGRSYFPYASPGIAEIYGVTPEEVREDATPVFGRIHPADYDMIVATVQESAKDLQLYHCEFRVILPGKGVRWRLCDAKPERMPDGSTLWYGIISDITARKQTEAALAESRAQILALVNNTDDLIWSVDTEKFGLVTFNRAFENHFQKFHQRQVQPGQTAEDLLPTEDAARWRDHYQRTLREGTFTTEQVTVFGAKVLLVSLNIVKRGNEVSGISVFAKDITERKAAETELRKLARAVEQSPVTVVITDPGGAIEYANPQFTKVTGYALEEVKGQNPRLLKSGVQSAETYRKLWAAISSGGEWHGELCNRRKDGSLYWEDASISPVVDEHGRITHYLAVKEDITERRHTQLALAESEKRFRSLAENLPNIAVQGYDRERRVVFWNPASTAIYGYTREEAMGRRLEDLIIPPEKRDAVIAGVNHWIATGEPIPAGELVMRRKDGSPVSVFSSHVMLKQSSGEPEMHCIHIDLTARNAAEAQIREQAALLDIAHDAIMVTDLERTITYWNRTAETLYEIPASEACGKKYEELVYREPPADYQKSLEELTLPGGWTRNRQQFSRSGKKIDVRVRATLVRDGQGAPRSILLVITDITESKRLETQFLRAQRMESLGALASGVAHDLNNVLTPILISVELLRPLAKAKHDFDLLQMLSDSARRGADIVQQLLLFGRGSDSPRTTMNAAGVIKELGRMMRETFPKNLVLSIEAPADLRLVEADKTQIHQVLLNLCVNARDAMPHGGRLSVTAENIQVDEPFALRHGGTRAGPYIQLRVADTGMGIPAAHLEKIFDPFFTTKPIGEGTGLGLATVLGIVRSHEGFLVVNSIEGSGTAFEVYLPAAQSAIEAAASRSNPLTLIGRGEWILLVDDEESIRSVLQQTLAENNYHVLVASDGAEALGVFAQNAAKIKLVITDAMMPVMDGAQTLHALRRLNPHLPAVAISGLSSHRPDFEKDFGPRLRFLSKPFSSELALHLVREALDEAYPPKPTGQPTPS